jgi:hypothetical protein
MNPTDDGLDELDRLLSRFYQAELPRPWPDCPTPESSSARLVMPERQTVTWLELSQRFASRLALALSVAVLLCGSWLLSGSFPGVNPTSGTPVSPGVARHAIEILPATAERGKFRVTEQFVQPKDGATRMNIEIIEVVPPSPR